ncbi:MAG: excinuclease ABC subunit UvrC [Nitrospirae bacterium]|nr:excinuclease ABC subunit UvrC [Nitrospirota bacterium]MCL5285554.1 excinuclease ABC subunit UvrC [Nitrospirota bacterium]
MENEPSLSLHLEEKLRLLPDSPGVYLMKGGEDEVLYVGKSKSLKDRVRSYFQKTRPASPRIRKMTERVRTIETLVTRSELDALILENTLIKKYRPRFNVLFRDDKTYPYLRFSWSETYPRLSVTRRVRPGKDLYFGPYANPGALRDTLKSIARLFPLATCTLDLEKTIERPCIEYQINRCLGPCAGLVSPDEYRKMAEGVRLFLEGKNRDLEDHLHAEMARHARDLDFEKAAQVREMIGSIRTILERQTVEFSMHHPVDAIALVSEGPWIQIQLLSIRNGRVSGRREVHIKNPDGDAPEDLLLAFLEQHYSQETAVLPDEILLSHSLSSAPLMSLEWMTEKKGERVSLLHPKRGERKIVLELAIDNAREALRERVRSQEDRLKTLEDVRELLSLPSSPRSIGCVDISNTGDAYPVASLVVFVDGIPDKSLYRRFRIRYGKGQDDFRMLAEVLERHFDDQPLPDLLLIDGGRPQLRASLEALEKMNRKAAPFQVMGLAKERNRTGKLERIVAEEFPEPLLLPPHRAATHLLLRIRDEAHRFAITYHRKIREEALTRSRLLEIPGIGPSRERQLIQAFGSVESLRAATPEEISRRCSLPAALAGKIRDTLIVESSGDRESS